MNQPCWSVFQSNCGTAVNHSVVHGPGRTGWSTEASNATTVCFPVGRGTPCPLEPSCIGAVCVLLRRQKIRGIP